MITKDFTSSNVTVAAQSAKQVAISFNVPSGYKMLNNVTVKTNVQYYFPILLKEMGVF